GFYLDAEQLGEILLPKKYAPKDLSINDKINVFIYFDSEDRPIATTQIPFTQVGEYACLKIVSVAPFGAFADWGLLKDLLIPENEQNEKIKTGKSYVVYTYIDKMTGRIVATTKFERNLDKTEPDYQNNQKVDLLVYRKTDLGYKAIIDEAHTGVLYFNELLEDLTIGQRLTGYVKKVRDDGKIDLSVQKMGYEKIDEISQKILDVLKSKGGKIAVSDKSSPEEIFKLFKESKKTYKKAVGNLYKHKYIIIGDGFIELTESPIEK
ncbi:MAG: S1-like domain-containing RNA-binding protein, partial [Candidatus Kapabacteria bacterium]|nr:S1-like domain-containing RNA-binding protein [Candidatus Kapabacteria bacterium]